MSDHKKKQTTLKQRRAAMRALVDNLRAARDSAIIVAEMLDGDGLVVQSRFVVNVAAVLNDHYLGAKSTMETA